MHGSNLKEQNAAAPWCLWGIGSGIHADTTTMDAQSYGPAFLIHAPASRTQTNCRQYIFIEKYPYVSGLMQFKPVLLKGELESFLVKMKVMLIDGRWVSNNLCTDCQVRGTVSGLSKCLNSPQDSYVTVILQTFTCSHVYLFLAYYCFLYLTLSFWIPSSSQYICP